MSRVLVCLLLVLAGCADGRDARPNAERIAGAAGLRRVDIQTDPFRLFGYVRFAPSSVLRVYLEGDGHAWTRRDLPSDDPTPWAPVALELAVRDPAPSVAYLARPCQYVAPGSDPACDVYYWTDGRYAEPVIASMSAAVDRLRTMSGAVRIDLIGFSGGGAVAALLAARRSDVASLRTVAANLDIAVWTEREGVRPLRGSLNPADFTGTLEHIPQLHFSGASDSVVETAVARAYRRRFGRKDCVTIAVVPGAGHGDGWADAWPDLLRRPLTCADRRYPSIGPACHAMARRSADDTSSGCDTSVVDKTHGS